ncbi:hypothetical protein BD324DRAFT_166569 [Kockovaella imperatae]|uniref:Uncharacterized protein n=1 Tax=Kockovaella imperatae TaxID=4999 RepID=A0A1Y1U9F5_9TREE|nr:hypothetical protein BD324DRAFT_166569 [Kockovaella imperatae]ORX34137.1 hypothetical protein BD324DRAFT_166569 [Kockovaella imperatae]
MSSALTSSLHVPNSFAPSHCGLELCEDLASEGYDSEEYDEMGELSDSPSSHPSISRPSTPLDIAIRSSSAPRRVRSHTHSASPPNTDHFTLAVKAERILGLTPGTLAHAKACLENARDEVKRTSQEQSPPPIDFNTMHASFSDSEREKVEKGGMRGKFDRAKKAMSVALPARMPSVVVGAGGKEEEERREKRRRAVDGVIYWQKMVEKLEQEQAAARQTARRR